MKVRMVCNETNREYMIDLPIGSKELIELQGALMERKEKGYILGADVKYYDMNNKEIQDIFKVNKDI